jgi:hypothetical protein
MEPERNHRPALPHRKTARLPCRRCLPAHGRIQQHRLRRRGTRNTHGHQHPDVYRRRQRRHRRRHQDHHLPGAWLRHLERSPGPHGSSWPSCSPDASAQSQSPQPSPSQPGPASIVWPKNGPSSGSNIPPPGSGRAVFCVRVPSICPSNTATGPQAATPRGR